MASAFSQLLQAVLGFWATGETVGPLDAPGGLVSTLSAYTSTMVVATATVGTIVAGTRLAITSSRVQEPARDLARGLLVLAAVAAGGAAAVQAVRSVLDGAADGLLAQGFDGSPIGSRLVALTDLQGGGVSPGVAFLLGLLGALSAFAQLFVMVVRGPVLAVLVGVLPIAAATTMTGSGTTHLRRLVAWISALTLYKFVAGLLYAAAFLAVDGRPAAGAPSGGAITGVVTGIALIVVAAGALPALVRLLSPAVEAVASAGSGGAAAAGAPSTGAVLLSGHGRQGVAPGLPTDAGPHTGAGLVRGGAGLPPTGSAGAPAARSRSAPADDGAPGRPVAGDGDGPEAGVDGPPPPGEGAPDRRREAATSPPGGGWPG
jgi:hypothetical protein